MASGNSVVLFTGTQGGRSTILTVGANGTIQVAANSTAGNSDLGNPTTNDPVLSATITSIWYSVTGGTVSVVRGSNTILILSGTGTLLEAHGWPGCNLFSTAPLTINFATAALGNGSVMMVVRKEYPSGDDAQQYV